MSHFLDRLRKLTQEREICADDHGTVTREDAYLLHSRAGRLRGGTLNSLIYVNSGQWQFGTIAWSSRKPTSTWTM